MAVYFNNFYDNNFQHANNDIASDAKIHTKYSGYRTFKEIKTTPINTGCFKQKKFMKNIVIKALSDDPMEV